MLILYLNKQSLRKEAIDFPTEALSLVDHEVAVLMCKLELAIIECAYSKYIFLSIYWLKHPELIDSSMALVLNYLIAILKFLATNI